MDALSTVVLSAAVGALAGIGSRYVLVKVESRAEIDRARWRFKADTYSALFDVSTDYLMALAQARDNAVTEDQHSYYDRLDALSRRGNAQFAMAKVWLPADARAPLEEFFEEMRELLSSNGAAQKETLNALVGLLDEAIKKLTKAAETDLQFRG